MNVKWEKALPLKRSDTLQSSKFANSKPFIPSFMKLSQKKEHNMFLLMAHEYARIYEEEKKIFQQRTYPPSEKATFSRKVVTRGLKNKKLELENAGIPPKLFKMKKFSKVPARVMHGRSPIPAKE